MSESIDYDRVATAYESRYERNDYSGVEQALTGFVQRRPETGGQCVLEVGSGTGHWLEFLRGTRRQLIGVDLSHRMLQVAQERLGGGRLVRARAERLPIESSSVDQIFCINALHHFSDVPAFFSEVRRVLRQGGGLLIVGLDPHTVRDQWWIYDCFPTVLPLDRKRYLPAERIRELMARAGLSQCETHEVQHRPARLTVSEAERRGFLNRTSTSQLMMISEAEYDEGMRRLKRDPNRVVQSDLRIYGTTGWLTE
jgi:ubiquinone/menaquinone biosynthesis C-methylase UbiE